MVQVELAHQHTLALDAEKLDLRVPHRGFVLADGDFEQGFDDLEQAGQHLGGGEILLHLLFAEGVTRFLELLAHIGPVPGLRVGQAQLAGREGAQVGQVFFCIGTCLDSQVAQELDDLGGRLGHLGHQRHLAKVGVAQQLGFFLAQGQDFVDERAVVKTQLVSRRLVRRPGHIGAVELFAQRAAVGELHHRQVAG